MRQRTGSVRLRGGVWYLGLRLRSGKWWERPIPRPADGGPYDESYADLVRARRVYDYVQGTWDPERPEVPEEPKPSDPSVVEYVRRWARDLDYESAPKDRARVELYLAPAPLGAVKVREVKPKDVAAWIGWLKKRPSARKGTLSASAVRNAFDVVQRAMDSAIIDELVATNPCRLVRKLLPAKRDKVPGARAGWVFERAEVERLLFDPALKADRRVQYALLFLTGMRFGEFAALRWSDWDRTMAPLTRLKVARAIKSVSRSEGTTKTGAVKEVPVHPALAEVLEDWHARGWAAAFGRPPTPQDFVLPSVRGRCKGQPRNESASNRSFKADQVALGMRVRHQHVARHTFITLAQDDGGEGAVLKWITHAPPASQHDRYKRTRWRQLCAEVAKLQIARPGGTGNVDGGG